MKNYSRAHLSDEALLRDLAAATGRERGATAEVLALIAEVDARKLHLPAGYPSMFTYCVEVLHLSEDAAGKRVTAARAARLFPVIFEAVADGRLHLSAVVLLAPNLTERTAEELLTAAVHKTRAQVEQILAERFPRSDMLAWVTPIPPAAPVATSQLVDSHAPGRVNQPISEASPEPLVGTQAPRIEMLATAKPLSAQSFAVQFTMSKVAYEKLRHAQELLGHPASDIARLFERALDALIPKLEKQKFAATSQPRRRDARPRTDPHYVPARIRRAVWERDGGQCTFVGESGHRCESRRGLQFDHVLEVARGGEASVNGIRLLCRAHNQYAAERTFGTEFMRHKRIAADEARAAAKAGG